MEDPESEFEAARIGPGRGSGVGIAFATPLQKWREHTDSEVLFKTYAGVSDILIISLNYVVIFAPNQPSNLRFVPPEEPEDGEIQD